MRRGVFGLVDVTISVMRLWHMNSEVYRPFPPADDRRPTKRQLALTVVEADP